MDFRQWVIGKLDENREIVMSLEEEAVGRMEGSRQNTPGSRDTFGNTQQ